MRAMREHNDIPKSLIWLFLLFLSFSSFGQSTCPNADFEQGNFNGWTGYRGGCCPITANIPGIVNGRHTIMSGGGMDPFSNGTLPVVAPGGVYSARLGNSNVGAQAERLAYSFLVDATRALFIYRYAVVLEDPNHTVADQPRFEINVFDQNGSTIDCGTYLVYSSAGIPGFETYIAPNGSVIHYKNWTSVGIDLTAYIGQMVTIDFAVGDCAQGGHFGYAYLDCYCAPLEISSDMCENDQFATLSAPSGFASYLWSNGETTQSITVPNPSVGTTYSCTITSFTGCSVVLNILLQPTVIFPNIQMTVPCQSTTLFSDATVVLHGSPITEWYWQFGDGHESYLQNPDHYYQQPGIYQATLIVTNSIGCTDTVSQQLEILPPPLADFSYTPECPTDPIVFVDESSTPNGYVQSWSWDMGDGSINNGQNIVHEYQDTNSHMVTLIVIDSAFCSDTVQYVVDYIPASTASFTYESSNCLDGGMQFFNTSMVNNSEPVSLIWDFGDGTDQVVDDESPYHVYDQTGQYDVSLIVVDATGCVSEYHATVGVQSTIEAGFSFGISCVGDTTLFMDASLVQFGNIVQWNWDFGDGQMVQTNVPQVGHIYQDQGQYQVGLTIVLDNGCTNGVVDTIVTLLPPIASFSYQPACPGEQFTFQPQDQEGSSPIIQHVWNMGDGSPELNASSLQYAYDEFGTYIVSYTINDANGCASTFIDTVATFDIPVADYFVPQGCVSFQIPFDNMSSIQNGLIVSSVWNFGDGSGSVGEDATHAFAQAGTYFVELTVESDHGCFGDTIHEVVVSDNPISDFTSTLACTGGVIELVNRSIAQNGSLVARQWSLDGGQTWFTWGDTLNTTFLTSGWHEVGLVTTNSAGCTDTLFNDVLILDPPSPSFIVDPVCTGQASEFINTSSYMTGLPIAFTWDLSNGFTSTDQDITFAFNGVGSFPVSLTMEYVGLDACSDSFASFAIVHPDPIPDVATVPTLCESNRVFLTDLSSVPNGYISEWIWTFENGHVSYVQNPVAPYMSQGVYDVQLTVVSNNGCMASTTFNDLITVIRDPVANFTTSPQNINIFNNTVHFQNTSTFATSYLWIFGDGEVSYETSPDHQFEAGDHDVVLIAYNSAGCADTVRATLSVSNLYTLYVPNTFTPNGDGFNDIFAAKGVNIKEFEMLIFNRWGELIYSADDIDDGWNGFYDGVLSQIDVYVYRIIFRDVFGIKHDLFGTVNLIR